MSPNGVLLLSVDEGMASSFHILCSYGTEGRVLLINFPRRVVLHYFNFKEPISAISLDNCSADK